MSSFHYLKANDNSPSKRSVGFFLKTSVISILDRISRLMSNPNIPSYLVVPHSRIGVNFVREWHALVMNDMSDPPPSQVTVQLIHHYKAPGALKHEALCFKLRVGARDVWIGAERDVVTDPKGIPHAARDFSKGLSSLSKEPFDFLLRRTSNDESTKEIPVYHVWTTHDRVWLPHDGSVGSVLKEMFPHGHVLVGTVSYEESPSPPTPVDLAHAFMSASSTMGPYDLTDANCYIYSASIRTILEQEQYHARRTFEDDAAGTLSPTLKVLRRAERIVEERYRENLILYHNDMLIRQPGAAAVAIKSAELAANLTTERARAEMERARAEMERAEKEKERAGKEKERAEKEKERAWRRQLQAEVELLRQGQAMHQSSSSSGEASSSGTALGMVPLPKAKGRPSTESTSSRR